MSEIKNISQLVRAYREGRMDDILGFGKHHGKKVGDIPQTYLGWASEETGISLEAPVEQPVEKKPIKLSGKLQEVMQELERQKDNRYDVVVPTQQLIAIYDAGTKTIKLDVPLPDKSNRAHGINPHAHRQIATKCGIPWQYYDKMMNESRPELLCKNINSWMPDKEQRMVRVLDGNVRALLSDKYRVIDNYDIVINALQQFERIKKQRSMDINVIRADLTEEHLYLKVTSPQLTDEILGDKVRAQANRNVHTAVNEPVEGGIIIRNSEVGSGAFSVQPFINVLVCQNGLIRTTSLRRVHIGRKLDAGFVDWSKETRSLEDKTLWSKINDMIHQTFDPEIFHRWVDEINEVASVEVPKPTIAVENIVRHFNLPKNKIDDLINQFSNESKTQWGLSMAVTRLAQDESNYETQIEMEKIGAQILDPKITKLVTATKEER